MGLYVISIGSPTHDLLQHMIVRIQVKKVTDVLYIHTVIHTTKYNYTNVHTFPKKSFLSSLEAES